MKGSLVLPAMLAGLAITPMASADTLYTEVSGECDGGEVRVRVDGLPETDETAEVTASACRSGDKKGTPVGIVESWSSWNCECWCYLGPDSGKSFACGEDECHPMSKEDCSVTGTGVLDIACDDLAGYDKICVGGAAHCNGDDEGCGPLSGAPPGNGGGGGCSASLGEARRGILIGFVAMIASALIALRKRRPSA